MNKKILGSLILSTLSLVLFLSPRPAYAVYGVADIVLDPANLVQNTIGAVANISYLLKENALDSIAWAVSKMIVQKLVGQTVNWVNSGFKGNPAYVTDPGQFFLNIGDATANRFLFSPGSSLNKLCAPFKPQVRIAIWKSYMNQTDETGQNYTCSISKVIANYDSFVQDFSQGGWDGWFAVTQNAQNNPYGAYITAKNDLSNKINTQVTKYSKQLDYGKGFFSYQKCTKGTEWTQADITAYEIANDLSAGDPAAGQVGDCDEENKQTVTPGSVIQEQLTTQLSSGKESLVQADEIDELIGSLLTTLIGKVVGGKGSLRDTTDPGTDGRTFIDQFDPGSPESIAQNAALEQGLINSTAPELKSPRLTDVAGGQPFIYLKGSNPSFVIVGSPYSEAGAGAFDVVDGDISNKLTVTGSVDTNTPGTYYINYDVTDSLGKTGNTVTRTVIVVTTGDVVQPPPPPQTCYDGIQNQNETGVDTGGICGGPGGGGGPPPPGGGDIGDGHDVVPGKGTNYYVSLSGDDANPGTIDLPFKTIRKGVDTVNCGENLYIRGGTYTNKESGLGVGPSHEHTCTSWSNPVTVLGYPGETVIVAPTGAETGMGFGTCDGCYPAESDIYWQFRDFILDGSNSPAGYFCGICTLGASYVRLQNIEIRNIGGQGALTEEGTGWEWINMNVHDTGQRVGPVQIHGLYLALARNVLVAGGSFYRNAGHGIQANCTNCIVRNALFYDNDLAPGGDPDLQGNGSGGFVFGPGANSIIYDSIFWHNAQYTIQLGAGCDGCKALNNTIYNYSLGIRADGANQVVKNNIIWGGVTPLLAGSASVSNNFLPADGDPMFVNAAGNDFHLKPGSPAIDKGADLSSIFNYAFDGTGRPKGAGWDIGAYEQ